MRFIFLPPAEHAGGLLDLPWTEPLDSWTDSRVIDIRHAGLHRHVVRFVAENNVLYVLKELPENLARREYRLLHELSVLGIPAVDVLGICVDRREDQDAILVTRFLEYSTTYRSLFANSRGGLPLDPLLDAMVQLLVRLHLAGFMWGDCSLSNTLFRLDAGGLAAYLVDAETAELHPRLSDGQRQLDLDLAFERVAGELLDMQEGDLLPDDIDPLDTTEEILRRYRGLWHEVTREDVFAPEEQRYKIAERLRRLNEQGFDVDEIELVTVDGGAKLRVTTRVAEPGYFRRLLLVRTGLNAEENQARRLMNDIHSFKAWLEQKHGRPVAEAVAANRWLTEVYDPVVAAIPKHLTDKLDQVQIFSEVLEHRWFLSERAGADVGTTAAAHEYMTRILPTVPDGLAQTAGSVRAGKHEAT